MKPEEAVSVQAEWARLLPLQMQSVLLLACRGPDNLEKFHPMKHVLRAYRGFVLNAAKYGRQLRRTDQGDNFMTLEMFIDPGRWANVTHAFFHAVDEIPLHYYTHLMHGVEILGYFYPEADAQLQWQKLYFRMVDEFHLMPESREQLERRLSDWNRKDWDKQ